ncbi:MAG: hypothetical protein JXM71_02190 [Spirochaetales bacterium]|nr:hypothetical protein [Spirochaetales bacterium]
MKRTVRFAMAGMLLIALATLGACSTLSVKIPQDMYVSSGDYVEGVRTEGIIQVQTRAWTPFFVLYDASEVRESLYKKLLAKADSMVGVDGITNVSFYSKPSPLSVLLPFTFGVGIWIDYYAEGVVITLD